MQLYSQDSEMRCIFTLICGDIPVPIRTSILGRINEECFHYPPAKNAYMRIQKLLKKKFEIIDYDDLVEDPVLDEDHRDVIRDAKDEYEPCSSKKQIKTLLDTLEQYRKLRLFYYACKSSLESLQKESVDIDELMTDMGNKLAKARRTLSNTQKINRIGRKSNIGKLLDKALSKTESLLIKTGFSEYDTRNGGFPEEGVVLLAGSVSGGKSTMLLQLAKNIYLNATKSKPKKIVRVSLEMGDSQELDRLLSNISGIKFFKFKQNKLTIPEKQKVKKLMKTFNDVGKKTKSQFDFLCPTKGMTIEEVFQMIKPYGYNVVGLDYVSLLEGVDEDNQARMLSSILRQAKVYSRETASLVVILCQLDVDSNKVRYSRGMQEHADVVWKWNYSKPEQRELKIIPVDVDKARDAELFRFNLDDRFDVMTLNSPQTSQSSYSQDKEDVDLSTSKEEDDDDDQDAYALS